MQCRDVAELLLASDVAERGLVDVHVRTCAPCAHLARGLRRVDTILASSLVVQPPLELQRTLAELAVGSAAEEPRRTPWWQNLLAGNWDLGALLPRPNVLAAQGLAALMLALASWQVFGWINTFRPVIGDVGYAMQLVVASPASVYLSGLQFDLQSLGLWSAIGVGGWLVSENGFIGRRLAGRFGL